MSDDPALVGRQVPLYRNSQPPLDTTGPLLQPYEKTHQLRWRPPSSPWSCFLLGEDNVQQIDISLGQIFTGCF